MTASTLETLYPFSQVSSQRLRYSALRRTHSQLFLELPKSAGMFFSAPGRTELCGNHTDHNLGAVVCAAVDMDIAAFATPRKDRRVRIESAGFPFLDLDVEDLAVHPVETGLSASIVRGIAKGIETLGRGKPMGFDAVMNSRIPSGSGLSSSAAYEVLIGKIFSTFSQTEISPFELAKVGQYAENVYFGKPSGLMDQMACAIGSALLIDFSRSQDPLLDPLDFDLGNHGHSLFIVGTGGSHEDLTPDYAAIPREMRAVAALFGKSELAGLRQGDLLARLPEIRLALGDRAFLRAWHFVKETQRSHALAQALREKDISRFLATVKDSGLSSLACLQNLSSPGNPREQGLLLGLALSQDCLSGKGAARVHGGGFAGTIQAFVPKEMSQGFTACMGSAFGADSVFSLHLRHHGVVCIERI
ncbi:MAG: galactokinase [Spirochaetes bacterium]|nr:MAG: galactokinase [Spirochaetota bacterium]